MGQAARLLLVIRVDDPRRNVPVKGVETPFGLAIPLPPIAQRGRVEPSIGEPPEHLVVCEDDRVGDAGETGRVLFEKPGIERPIGVSGPVMAVAICSASDISPQDIEWRLRFDVFRGSSHPGTDRFVERLDRPRVVHLVDQQAPVDLLVLIILVFPYCGV